MPSYLDGTLRDFVSRAAAAEPTPGGGSISALAGALGAAMGEMAGGFTAGRRRYADVDGEVQGLLAELERQRAGLLALVEEDADAYAAVDRAMKLPRGTEQQRGERSAALDYALRSAIEPPLGIMRRCSEVAEAACRLAEIGNRNLISDAGVGAVLAEAACVGAGLNVEANLKYIGDAALAGTVRQEIAGLTERCGHARERAVQLVNEHLRN